MPILKQDEVTPERPVIIVIYGTPGTGKTSLSTTSENPILIDTDRGYDRAVRRIDTLTAKKWTDITTEYEALKRYKTIVVDTAKATLDDYLAEYVCEKNFKLRTNTLKRFGQMADEFKAFVNMLRSNGADIIFICHDKETQEGDVVKHSPDCTGQSKDLLLRIADQVGFLSKQNNRRVITFEPTDNYTGKNVAELGPLEIPDSTSKEFRTCMAEIIRSVKTSIQSKSESQRQALLQLEQLRAKIDAIEALDQVDEILGSSSQLPQTLKKPFFNELKESLAKKGFVYDNAEKKFIRKD